MSLRGYRHLADMLEEKILSGGYAPNERLPSTKELAVTLRTAPLTIQRCLRRLQERGLVRRSPKKGTFINPRASGNVVGLLFGLSPFETASPFPRLLLAACAEAAPRHGLSLKYYIGVNHDDPFAPMRMVEQDVAAGSLTFLISIARTKLQKSWLEERCSCPWTLPRIVDVRDYTHQGVAHLLAQGWRRIAIISTHGADSARKEEAEAGAKAFAAAGLACPADILIRCGQTPQDGYPVMKKLLARGGARPEAVLVNNDLLTPGVLLAIAEAGLKIPRDIAVVSQENKGAEIVSHVPLTVLSVDAIRIADALLGEARARSHSFKPGSNTLDARVKAILIPRESSKRS